MELRQINLGCGKQHKEGFLNVDMQKPADLVVDVTKEHPFEDDFYDRIDADNVVEHFDNDEFLFVMNNMHDALKSGGLFWIKTPDALNWMDGAFGDPTHKRFFVPRSWNYLDITHQTWKEYGSAYGFKGWYVNVFTDKRFFICELTKP